MHIQHKQFTKVYLNTNIYLTPFNDDNVTEKHYLKGRKNTLGINIFTYLLLQPLTGTLTRLLGEVPLAFI